MMLICPECKNTVDLSLYPHLAAGNIIECSMCGITLQVTKIGNDGMLSAEVVDEGK